MWQSGAAQLTMQSVDVFTIIVTVTSIASIVVIILLFYCFYRAQNHSTPTKRVPHHRPRYSRANIYRPLGAVEDIKQTTTTTTSATSLRRASRSTTTTPRSSKMSYDSRDTEWMARSGHDPRTRAIAITKFAEGYERIKEMYPGIRAEHDELEKICTHTLYNNQPLVTYTPGKDKYRDILPYAKHAQVKLDGKDDYINASFVPGASGEHEYISTQSPMSETRDDFFRMLLKYNVAIVVMLNLYTERNCVRYFPDDKDKVEVATLDGVLYSVKLVNSDKVNKDIVVNTVEFVNNATNETRTVKQFHFQSWRDFSIPSQALLDFIERIRLYRQGLKKDTPVVVHCSAGVGRTGVFIALDQLWHQITVALNNKSQWAAPPAATAAADPGEGSASPQPVPSSRHSSSPPKEPTVDIFGTVYRMRMCRRGMVQTESQYEFLYDTIEQILAENRLIKYDPSVPKVWSTRP